MIKKESKKNVNSSADNEDEILRKYFENERNTYGNETIHLKPKYWDKESNKWFRVLFVQKVSNLDFNINFLNNNTNNRIQRCET